MGVFFEGFQPIKKFLTEHYGPVEAMDKLLRWLNKALMIDLFLVFFFFIWFVVAAIADSMHFNLGWSLWQQLWQPLIQPVLGIMMAGAIASGVIPKISARLRKDT